MTCASSLCFAKLVRYCCAGHRLFLLKPEPVTATLANFAAAAAVVVATVAAVAKAEPGFLWPRD